MALKIKMVVHRKTEYTDYLDFDRQELGTVDVVRLTLLTARPEEAQEHDPTRFVITGEFNCSGPTDELGGFSEGDAVTVSLGSR